MPLIAPTGPLTMLLDPDGTLDDHNGTLDDRNGTLDDRNGTLDGLFRQHPHEYDSPRQLMAGP